MREGAPISQRRILLIDADPSVRQTLAELLEGQGHVVVEAERAPDPMPEYGLIVADPALLAGPVQGGVPVVALTKPVRLSMLLARVEDALRQAHTIALGPWTFHVAARMLVDGSGRRVRLTDKEAAILERLSQTDSVVAREALLAEVWGYSTGVTTHTLETHIYRLRRKIEADPANATLLVTEAGGYRLAR